MRLASLFLCILAVLACAGCSDSTGPSSSTTSGFAPTSDFGYAINGIAFSRSTAAAVTQASATLDQYGVNGSGFLRLHFRSLPLAGPSMFVDFAVVLDGPVPHSYAITSSGIPANATLSLNNVQYAAMDSGVFTITKFDTAANVISGAFHFAAVQNGDTEKVTSGYFTNVGIYAGGYGQGTVTAEANHDQFPFAAGGPENVTAFIQSGTSQLEIDAIDASSGVERDLLLTITNPRVGTFSIGPNPSVLFPEAEYATSGGSPDVSISSQTGTTGTLTLTQFDSATHRMSGTFQFSGPDASTGETVLVLDGTINNVQWFVL